MRGVGGEQVVLGNRLCGERVARGVGALDQSADCYLIPQQITENLWEGTTILCKVAFLNETTIESIGVIQ